MSKRAFTDCVLGEDVVAEGKIDAPGMVRIDGNFSGDITSGASVIISKDAVVHADIRAQNLMVAGFFSALRLSSTRFAIPGLRESMLIVWGMSS